MACILLVFSVLIEKCTMMVIVFVVIMELLVFYDSCNFCNIYSLNVDNSNVTKHEFKHLLLIVIYIVLW